MLCYVTIRIINILLSPPLWRTQVAPISAPPVTPLATLSSNEVVCLQSELFMNGLFLSNVVKRASYEVCEVQKVSTVGVVKI